MPDATANYGLRIPKQDGTDLIVPDDVRVPITSIDGLLKTTNDNNTNINNALTALAARVTALEADAATIVSGASALAIGTGWSLTTVTIEKRGHKAFIFFNLKRTGATVGTDSLGNLPNQNLGVVTAGNRPSQQVAWSPQDILIPCFGYIDTAGNIIMTLTAPNVDLTINTDVRGSAMYWLP